MMVTKSQVTTPTTIHVGLDVAKLTLQVDLQGKALALPNTPAGHRTPAHPPAPSPNQNRPVHPCRLRGHRRLRACGRHRAASRDIAASVHNAARVRAFARAQGRLAKTDALDAAVLSDFGAAMQPESDTPPTESEAALEALVVRRDQLKELVALEARREEHHHHPGVKKEAALLQKQLAAHLEKIEAQIS